MDNGLVEQSIRWLGAARRLTTVECCDDACRSASWGRPSHLLHQHSCRRDLGEVIASLESHVPAIKQRVTPNAPMGVGLRLSAIAAEELSQPAVLTQFREFLSNAGSLRLHNQRVPLRSLPRHPGEGTRLSAGLVAA